MKIATSIALLLLAALAGRSEIIDRVAVTVDRMVITQSDVLTHIRVAAFLDDRQPVVSPETRRQAARQLVEQLLIRREMEISRYPAPDVRDVEALLESLRQERGLGDRESYAAALDEYGISEQDVRDSLFLQLTLLRFIEFRFRPGIALEDAEVEEFYARRVAEDGDNGVTPELDDIRDEIEEFMIQQRVDEELDTWLERAAGDADIRYRTEAFE